MLRGDVPDETVEVKRHPILSVGIYRGPMPKSCRWVPLYQARPDGFEIGRVERVQWIWSVSYRERKKQWKAYYRGGVE